MEGVKSVARLASPEQLAPDEADDRLQAAEPCLPHSALQAGSTRQNVSDYVQDVLAGFRRKLQSRPASAMGAIRPSGVDRGQPAGTPAHYLDAASLPSDTDETHRPEVRNRATLAEPPATPSVECVLAACPGTLTFVEEQPRTWSQLFEAAWRIGRSLQIADDIMARAAGVFGRNGLAITLFAICERHASIRQPAAYLRALCHRPGFRPASLLQGLRLAMGCT